MKDLSKRKETIEMYKFTVMTIVEKSGKHRTVKVVSTRILPDKRKEPVGQAQTRKTK